MSFQIALKTTFWGDLHDLHTSYLYVFWVSGQKVREIVLGIMGLGCQLEAIDDISGACAGTDETFGFECGVEIRGTAYILSA